jgi:hypothetical protein
MYALLPISILRKITKKYNEKWKKDGKAGYDWFRRFVARNCELSLQMPERTSITRGYSFNRHNVGQFLTIFVKSSQEKRLAQKLSRI